DHEQERRVGRPRVWMRVRRHVAPPFTPPAGGRNVNRPEMQKGWLRPREASPDEISGFFYGGRNHAGLGGISIPSGFTTSGCDAASVYLPGGCGNCPSCSLHRRLRSHVPPSAAQS